MAGLRLVAELGGDGSGFERMMGRAGASAKSFGSTVIMPLKNLIAGAFTVGAISSLTRKTIQWASELRDVADALGVNVEWLQKMQNGAKLVGGDIGDIEKMILELNRNRQEALQNPKGDKAQAFGRFGINSSQVENLSTQAFFDKLVKAFSGGATTQMANDLQEVGGRSARNLIAAFANQFQNDIPILADQLLDQLDDIGDEFTSLAQKLKIALAPSIIWVADKIMSVVNKIKVLGAGLGAVTSKIKNPFDVMGLFINPKKLEEEGKLPEAGTVLDAMAEEILRQQKELEQIEAGRTMKRELRKKRENSPPQFDPLAITPKSKTASPDSLVRIGNFLGSAPGAVNAIAEKQLDVARQHLSTSAKILDAIKQLKPSASGSGSIEVPGN